MRAVLTAASFYTAWTHLRHSEGLLFGFRLGSSRALPLRQGNAVEEQLLVLRLVVNERDTMPIPEDS